MKVVDDIPEDERPFQRRLMEVAAGFAEHCGRPGRPHRRRAGSARLRGQHAVSDLGRQRILGRGPGRHHRRTACAEQHSDHPSTHIDALEQLGGLDVLGSPKTDNQYHSGWGWAGSTPYKGVKLLASHLGGTRNPLAIRWPKKVAADSLPRDHFLHVNDVVPTIYDIVGIEPPLTVHGAPQIPIAGASFARHPHRPLRVGGQEDAVLRGHGQSGYLSRRLDGLDVRPARALAAGSATRNPRLDTRQRPMGALPPRRGLVAGPRSGRRDVRELDQMRELFAIEAARNSVLPIGAGLWVPVFHPELRISPPYREWEFPGDITRIPEFCAPARATRTTPSPSRPIDRPTPAGCCMPSRRLRRAHLLSR